MALTVEQKKQVVELRNNTDMGYGEIADLVGADTRYQVRSFLKTKGALKLGLLEEKKAMADTGQSQSYEDREKHFAKLFEKLQPTFKYHSGYISATERFKCACKECGHVQERSAEMVRPSYRDYNLQCDRCLESRRVQRKEKVKSVRRLRMSLKKIERHRKMKLEREKYVDSLQGHTCNECAVTFVATSKGNKYCSYNCMQRNVDRVKKLRRRRNAHKNGKVDSSIGLGSLINRDDNTCYLCNEPCDGLDYIDTVEGHFIAGGSYPSIDHVIPISKGGTHTWDNVRLAHHYCNSVKRDSVV